MKRNIFFTITLLSLSFSINNQEKQIDLVVIDVENGQKNLSDLKVSDFGKTIRYVPLETSNAGLVGRNPVVKVLRNYIVVEYKSSSAFGGTCLLFSKKTGLFIAQIGHEGRDPGAYTDCFSWSDENEEFLFFKRLPNQLVKYDMKGNYCGKIEFSPSVLASYYLITNSEIFGYFDSFDASKQSSNHYPLGIFEKDGILKDTVPPFFPNTTPISDDIFQINVVLGNKLYNSLGSWARGGAVMFEYTPARTVRQINAFNAARIWKYNEQIRFKQDFVDTIYTVIGSKLIPSVVFNTGKFHWPVQERRSEKNNRDRIFIADINENSNFIFFQCIQGMLDIAKGTTLYNGLYNKNTRETKLAKNKDCIEDDINHFIPFKPLGISSTGEFVSFVEAWEVMNWLEKHPEAKHNSNLSFLKKSNDDMNPIIILIE